MQKFLVSHFLFLLEYSHLAVQNPKKWIMDNTIHKNAKTKTASIY